MHLPPLASKLVPLLFCTHLPPHQKSRILSPTFCSCSMAYATFHYFRELLSFSTFSYTCQACLHPCPFYISLSLQTANIQEEHVFNKITVKVYFEICQYKEMTKTTAQILKDFELLRKNASVHPRYQITISLNFLCPGLLRLISFHGHFLSRVRNLVV